MLDCEGTLCRNQTVVREGVLAGLLHNLSTADKTGGELTGNAGRKVTISGVVQTDIRITPKNLVILPGENSLEDMISRIREGILLIECFDEFHCVDMASGDFSVPGEGVLIRDGRLQERLVNLTIEGNLLKTLSDIRAVGRESCIFPIPDVRSFVITAPALHVGEIKISV